MLAVLVTLSVLTLPVMCNFDDPCVGKELLDNVGCEFYLSAIADYSYAYYNFQKKVVYAELFVDSNEDVEFIGL